MEDVYKKQLEEADKRAAQVNAQQDKWPTTAAPAVYTKTPEPAPYTNPPVVVPGTGGPPPKPPKPVESDPVENADAVAITGTSGDSDFRTDLSEYHLVVVRDKDVPNTAGYDPRGKLKWFPRGHLPGGGETFYLVTHRFADRANINAEFRGDVVISANTRGIPRPPLAAEKHKDEPRDESATGTPAAFTNFPMSTWIAVVIIAILVVYIIMMKNKRETAHGQSQYRSYPRL